MERHWRTVVTAAAILVVLSVLWGVSQTNARRTAERQLAASYQERFFDAVAHIENIEVLLGKAILALAPAKRSDELSVTLFSDLWRQAFAAQANLTQLPLLQGALMHTGKYLTQVGDFGYMLARKISAGEAIDEEDLVKTRGVQARCGGCESGYTGSAGQRRSRHHALVGHPAKDESSPGAAFA